MRNVGQHFQLRHARDRLEPERRQSAFPLPQRGRNAPRAQSRVIGKIGKAERRGRIPDKPHDPHAARIKRIQPRKLALERVALRREHGVDAVLRDLLRVRRAAVSLAGAHFVELVGKPQEGVEAAVSYERRKALQQTAALRQPLLRDLQNALLGEGVAMQIAVLHFFRRNSRRMSRTGYGGLTQTITFKVPLLHQ